MESHLDRAAVSTVNLAEVMQRSVARGLSVEGLTADLEALGVTVLPILWSATHGLGLSLGDRACLALARRLSLAALTADRVWGNLKIEVEIQVIR